MIYSKDLIDAFRNISTASVADACDTVVGRRCYMSHEMKPRINTRRIVGPAKTVMEGPTDEKLPPQFALDLVEDSEPGSVIVIGIEGGVRDVALWGGLMTAGAHVRGLEGCVLEAGVRDVTEIKRDYDFPVFSRTVSPGTTVGRYKTLAKNVEVCCGDLSIFPDDLIVGDADGVVCVPQAHVESVLILAQEIETKEMEQAKYIKETKSLKQGLAKYNRI